MGKPIETLQAAIGWRLRHVRWPRRFHFYRAIPGFFGYRHLYQEMVKRAPSPAHFVEVGSWKGRSSAFMAVEIANSGKSIKFDCVDHWCGSDEDRHHIDPDVLAGTLFAAFQANTAPVRRYLTPIRSPSVDAARRYADKSLDFVMLDGAHDYESVRDDITAWRPKVKPGGIFAGDDFRWSGVAQAVQELLPNAEPIHRGAQWKVIIPQ